MSKADWPETGEPDAQRSLQITYEGLRAIFALARGTTFSKTAVVSIVAMMLWAETVPALLLAWVVLMVAGILFQEYNAQMFFRRRIGPDDTAHWRRRLIVSWAYLGLLWAVAIVLFFNHDSSEAQIFLIAIALIIASGNIIPAHYCLPLYHVYSMPIMLALAARFAVEGTLLYGVLAAVVVWAMLAGARFAQILNLSFREQVRLRLRSHAMAEMLSSKTAEAEKATLAKSRFLAAASHDLRQPLHAISLFVDVIHDEPSEQARARLFPQLQQSIETLRKLFEGLLDVSRLDAKVVKPDYSHFDIQRLLQALVDEFSHAAAQKGLKLTLHADAQVVVSDCLLLERILRNLIANALRYTDSGGILVSARRRNDHILLQVWDTGIGIAACDHEEIFEEYRQLHNRYRDRSQGLGLGLALVRRMGDLLDIPVSLRSRVGRGSVFSLQVQRGNAIFAEPAGAVVQHSWDLRGRRVMVIDDEAEILDAMYTLLTRWGCDVRTADGLRSATEQLERSDFVPDLILSDLRLRDGESGVDVLNILRHNIAQPVIGILITGDIDPVVIKHLASSGYEVLQKPVRPAYLRTVMHSALSAGV